MNGSVRWMRGSPQQETNPTERDRVPVRPRSGRVILLQSGAFQRHSAEDSEHHRKQCVGARKLLGMRQQTFFSIRCPLQDSTHGIDWVAAVKEERANGSAPGSGIVRPARISSASRRRSWAPGKLLQACILVSRQFALKILRNPLTPSNRHAKNDMPDKE